MLDNCGFVPLEAYAPRTTPPTLNVTIITRRGMVSRLLNYQVHCCRQTYSSSASCVFYKIGKMVKYDEKEWMKTFSEKK